MILPLLSLLFLQAEVGFAAAAVPGPPDAPDVDPTAHVDFIRDIEPIFAAKCHGCHGASEHRNGLRLDRKNDALQGGDSGVVIVPGRSRDSLLIQYITGNNEAKLVMPPKGGRLSTREVALLSQWVDQGAPWPEPPESATPPRSEHWAFQPVRRPALPAVRHAGWIRTPIDAFILTRLEMEGIEPSPPADRRTYIRRLSLDLTGLPPSPADVDAYLQDHDPAADEKLVSRLLASAHFGERWARHWLDLARYGDTDGFEDDKYRPDAWRYRDWVIRAINDDMAFDLFTVLQVGGDLVPGAGPGEKIATGFHRMTLSNNAGAGGIQEEYRVKNVKDRLATVGTTWLGLTLGCAECHSHKYDPISLREYYQLYGFFNNIDEISIPAPRLGGRYQREFEEATEAFNNRLAAVRKALEDYESKVQPGRQKAWEPKAARDPETPPVIRSILDIPPERRSPGQQADLKKHFRSIDPDHARLKAAIPVGDEVGNNKPLAPSEKALVVAESPERRRSHIQRKGNFLKPGAEVQASTPAFLPSLRPRGQAPDRLDLARWIVAPENPLTRRVAVNHLWQHLFGRGLVSTPDNLGAKGERPSHPELLDWLADEFMARHWSRKEIIRMIVTSATYRQASRARPELAERDPGNALLARQNRLRLEAECIRDAALAVSGLLNAEIGGPSFQPPLPAALSGAKELKNERFMETSPASHRHRRGVYINVQRTFLFPSLKTFDVADATVCTVSRDRSNTALQALTLLNDPVFFEAAQALGRRAITGATDTGNPPAGTADISAGIRLLYRTCLSRDPDTLELDALRSLHTEQSALAGLKTPAPSRSPAPDSADDPTGWEGVARAVINLDEFITRE